MNTTTWISRVQERVAAHTSPTADPNHGQTDSVAWVVDTANAIMAEWPEGWETWTAADPRAFDENMRLARELGLVLCAWFASVARAKSMDPNRPIAGRKMSHDRRHQWIQELLRAVVDNQYDPLLFPGQAWESPYLPDATDGTFI